MSLIDKADLNPKVIVLSHPTGNANVRQTVQALGEAGLLREFVTSLKWDRDSRVNWVLPRSIRSELGRRSFADIGRARIYTSPCLDAARLLASRLKLTTLTKHETGLFSVDAVYRQIDRTVAARLRTARGVKAVYAYEDGARATFRIARQQGIKTVYELPIGYWRAGRLLLEEESCLKPEWSQTLPGNADSDEKLQRKDEEIELSDHVIVPSNFVLHTLSAAHCLRAPVSVIPYGAPTPWDGNRPGPLHRSKLRVIFVGALSQRKGLSYLLEAIERLGAHVSLTLLGAKVGQCRPLEQALRRHRWIPTASHSKVIEEMRLHDVLVFPSLFEGFGLVLLEAMSQGLPVITTPNTAGPDIVNDGEDGFIVPIRSAEAITAKLELLMHNPELLWTMSQAAMAKAVHLSWHAYRAQVVAKLRHIVGA